jgi:hypothetical protein
MMKNNSNYTQDKNKNICITNAKHFELHPELKPDEKKRKYVYNKSMIFKDDKKHK